MFFFTSLAHDRVQYIGSVEGHNAHTKFRRYRLTVSEVQMGRTHTRTSSFPPTLRDMWQNMAVVWVELLRQTEELMRQDLGSETEAFL